MRFDWRRGNKFSTCAIWWIRQAIDREVCSQAEPIRIPVHVCERRRRLARVRQALTLELEREPSLAEVAAAAALSPAQVEQAPQGTVSTTCDALPAQQRQVIALRYGMTGEEGTTDQTTADLDISPLQVRALERTALQRLRELSSLAELEQAA